MKKLKIIKIFFCLIVVLGCSTTYQIKPYDGPKIIELTNFCELDKIESGSYISTIAFYTGIEEYWGLTSNTKCKLDHKVYLNTEENFQDQQNKILDKKFSKLYNNYWKYSLKLEITGKLEKTDKELGFGHLGMKKLQIIPYQIRVLEKRKIKLEQ